MIGSTQPDPIQANAARAAGLPEERVSGLPDRPERLATIVPIASAAAAGAGIGVFSGAGFLGFLVGAILGGGAGALVGRVSRDRERRSTERDSLLDAQIGVTEGDLGAAQYRVDRSSWGGAYSAASAGASVSSPAPAGGPIPR